MGECLNPDCRRSFPPRPGPGRPRLYCDAACRRAALGFGPTHRGRRERREVAEKVCRCCGETKPRDEFRPDDRLLDGLSSWCRACHLAASRRWRESPEGRANVEARNAARRRGSLPPRECAYAGCDESFVPARRDQIYCSGRCGRRAKPGTAPRKSLRGTTRLSYRMMLDRCRRPTRHNWEDYGGRGIAVCERWLGPDGYANFVADMGERPAGTTIDRVDPDGNYEPGNCRWATPVEQSRNTRKGRRRAEG